MRAPLVPVVAVVASLPCASVRADAGATVVVAATEIDEANESAAAVETRPDPWSGWRFDFMWLGQPDQPTDETCSRLRDCWSTTRSFHAAALRASFVETDVWAAALTLGLGHAYDWERRPASGFGVFSARADITVEILRTSEDFGAAVRVSPIALYGWAGDGGSFEIDFPGVAAVFGWRDLWAEIALPAMPTHADPRLFYVQGAWRDEVWALAASVGTFASHAFAGDDIEKTGSIFGVWLEARARLWRDLEVRVSTGLSYPTTLGLTIGWAPSDGTRAPALLDHLSGE
jgi:hypothetical protein